MEILSDLLLVSIVVHEMELITVRTFQLEIFAPAAC